MIKLTYTRAGLIISFVILMGIVSALASAVLLSNFAHMEEDEIENHLALVFNILSYHLDKLSQIGGTDWVQQPQTFSPEKATFLVCSRLQVNLLVLANSSGHIQFAQACDTKLNQLVPIPASLEPYLKPGGFLLSQNNISKGIIAVPEGILLLAAIPIIDDTKTNKIVVGRYLDNKEFAQLIDLSHVGAVNLYRLSESQLPNDVEIAKTALSKTNPSFIQIIDEHNIAGYLLLKNIEGVEVLILRLLSFRGVYQQGLIGLRHLLVNLLVIGTLLGIVILWLSNQYERARSAFQQNEQRLKLLSLGEHNDYFWEWNIHTGVVQMDVTWTHLLGYNIQDIEPSINFLNKLVHPQDLPRLEKAVQNHLNGHTTHYEIEHRLRAYSGEWKWILIIGKVVTWDEYNRPVYLAGTHTDITARKQIEAALRQSEAYLQSILNNASAGIVLFDINGHYLQFSAKWLEMIGYSAEELSQRTFLDVTHSDDVAISEQKHQSLVNGQKDAYFLEKRYVRKDGGIFWGEVSAVLSSCTNSDGEIMQTAVAVITDITERKKAEKRLSESEEQLRTLINAIPDIICLKDKEGRWLEANKAYLQLFKLEGIDYKGKKGIELMDSAHDIYHEAFLCCEASNERAWQLGTLHRTEELIPNTTGETRVLDIIKVPIFDTGGNPKMLVVLGRDITDRKLFEEQLREAEAKYHTLVEQLPAVTYIAEISQKPQLRYISPQVEAITGFPRSQWLDPEAGLWHSLIHTDDRKRVISEYMEYVRELPSDRPLASEYRMLDHSNEIMWIRGQAIVVRDQNNHPQFLQGIIMDITERKQAEEALEQANAELHLRFVELNQRNKEITLLSEIGNLLQTCLTVEEAYTVIAHFMARLFPHTQGMLGMLKASSNLIERVATWGDLTEVCKDLVFAPADCWALRRGKVYRVQNIQTGLLCNHLSPLLASAYLCVPMMAQGELLGLLHIARLQTAQGSLDDAHQSLAETVAEHIALALSNLRLRETLRSQSIRDPLTGLFNRRYLEETLEREIHRAGRSQQTVGVVMLDLDHFKRFNDTFGHDAGDAILHALGSFLSSHIRRGDIACRYGGEEFTLILPGAPADEALKRAQFLKDEVKQMIIQHRDQVLGSITLSMGIGVFPTHGRSTQEVLRAADAALYRAKQRGRDRVELADNVDKHSVHN